MHTQKRIHSGNKGIDGTMTFNLREKGNEDVDGGQLDGYTVQ
jgi:hypothetical protein